MLKVKLSSCGNSDFPEQRNIESLSPKKTVNVHDLKQASKVCRDYIEEYDLGGGNWIGGQVFDGEKQIARISYNGRIWDLDDKEIL